MDTTTETRTVETQTLPDGTYRSEETLTSTAPTPPEPADIVLDNSQVDGAIVELRGAIAELTGLVTGLAASVAALAASRESAPRAESDDSQDEEAPPEAPAPVDVTPPPAESGSSTTVDTSEVVPATGKAKKAGWFY